MTNGQDVAAGEPSVLLRAEDGTAYAIPRSIVEAYRLSDEEWSALEARALAGGCEVAGYQFIGTFGSGTPGPPVPPYDPTHPAAGGWDGVGLRYIPPGLHVIPATTVSAKGYGFPR